jgi:predicted helicase
LAARGNGMVYASLRATPTDTGGYKVSENINNTIKGLFTNHKEDYIFYIYAILSSNYYQGAFYGKLFSSSNPGDPIRIPILAQQADRDAITLLGRELAEFENFSVDLKKSSTSSFKVISNFTVGQEDFSLKIVNYDNKNEVLNLMDEGSNQISILGINEDIYGLQISGHIVLERWLQYRKFAYLNRGLVPSDVDELLDLLERISGQFDRIAKIDKFLLKTLSASNVIAP